MARTVSKMDVLKRKLKKIRMLVVDVDGVLTDGGIVLGSNGQEFKVFDVQDGMGITLARMGGVKIGIITGRESEAVAVRAQELHCDALYQGSSNKLEAYREVLGHYDYRDEDVCYVGDDVLDISVMGRVGVAVAVANARPEVKKVADYVTKKRGGKGAVREIVELILKSQGKWKTVLQGVTSNGV